MSEIVNAVIKNWWIVLAVILALIVILRWFSLTEITLGIFTFGKKKTSSDIPSDASDGIVNNEILGENSIEVEGRGVKIWKNLVVGKNKIKIKR